MGNFFENFISEADKRRKQIANVASRTVDQVNPFDNNRTFKQRTPTQSKSNALQIGQIGGQTTRTLAGNTLKFANTANLGARQVANTAKMYGAQLTDNPDAFRNANQASLSDYSRFSNKGGLLNRGTFFKSPEEAARGDFKTVATRIGGGTLGTASEILPVARGGSFATKGVALRKALPRVAAESAAYGAAGSVGNQLVQNGRVDPMQTIKDTAISTGLGVGTLGAVRGASNAIPTVQRGAQNTAKAIQAADQKAFTPRVNIDDQAALRAMSDYLGGASKETGADLSATIRGARAAAERYGIDINAGSRADRLNAVNSVLDQIGRSNKDVGQGGFIKNPLAPDGNNGDTTPQSTPAPNRQPAQLLPESRQTIATATNADGTSLPPTIPRTTRVQLNTQRINLPDEARQRLDDDTAEVINRLSNDDVQRAAKSAGIDTKSYTPEKTRQKIAEQLNLRKDTVRLQNEAKAARQAGDLDRAAQLLKESAEAGRASRTQGTDIARQLQARKIIANELDTPPQKIFKLLDNAGVDPDIYTKRYAGVDFNNSNEVVAAYRELVPPKFGDWLDVVRYNSMLSSPLTHIVNIGSNAINVGVIAPIEKTLRGVADATGGLFGRERRYAAGEGAAYASGAARSLKDAADSFLNAMRTGENQTPDITDISTPLAVGGVKGAAYDTLSFPMKLLGASDKFFRTIAEAGEEGALTAREKAGIKLGGNREALRDAEASYRLYQQDTDLDGQGAILKTIDQVANAIQTLRKKNRVFGFIFPFVRTPTNILKQGVEYSPLGFANLPGVDDKLTAITRASIGTAVFGASAAMLAAGDLTWAEPINPEEKARWRAEGKQPYSMRVNGANVNFSKLPPGVAFPFALTAAIDDAINNKKMDTKTADAIMQGVAKWGQFLGDQSYLKQIGDTLALVKGDPEKAVQAVSNYPQQVIPFRALTGWIARMTDDTDRKINTDKSYIDKQVQSLMLNYPGLRQQVDERTYRGEAIPANNPVLNSFIPFKVTDDRGVNPIDQELDAAKKQEVKNELLTDGQNKEVQKRAGGLVSEAQKQFLNSAEYKSLSPDDRKRGLEAIKKDVTEIESRKYQAENNIGMYAQDYKGEQKKLSTRQTAIENGNFDASAYATKGDSSNRKVLKNDDRGTALLDKVGTMNDDQKKQWETQDFDEKYADLIERANQVKTDDMPAIPKTNKALKAYADYLKVRDGKPSELKLNDAKKDFLKAAYSSQVSDNARELYSSSYSADDKINALMSGAISPDDFEKALQLDNQLISWGLQATPKISNKIRREFGYDDAPSPSGSGGGRGGKITPSDFKLPDFITQYGIKGANLAASARLR
jgi:hypothetical protein